MTWELFLQPGGAGVEFYLYFTYDFMIGGGLKDVFGHFYLKVGEMIQFDEYVFC